MPKRRNFRLPSERTARFRIGATEFEMKGISRFDPRDPYYFAVALNWPQFLIVLFGLYLSVNLVFAALFWLVPGSVANARPGRFADNFFFSIETLATVGYGAMYPATLYGHVVAAIEIMCGVAFTAVLAGLTFVRFSRPRAKLVFAANPVVAMHNGMPTLMVRIGNGRANVLMDATAKLNIFYKVTDADDKPLRRGQELPLARAHVPIFPAFWTLMHVLDERSPLRGYDAASAIEADARVFVILQAHDPTLGTVVHGARFYEPEDIRFGMRYTDALTTAKDGTLVVDMTRFGAVEPDIGDRPEPGWTELEEVR